MTLQLKVGGTYRARNGDVVRIVGRDVPHSECDQMHPFLGDDEISYAEDGEWNVSQPGHKWGLIKEVSPASELDAAIAKFEADWGAAKQAMDKAQLAAEDVAHAIRAAKESANEQG